MSDWDAGKYHRISDPQLAWGRAVAARLMPSAGERILDLGCGTGRLTAEMAQMPEIIVVGLDASAAMLAQAYRGQTPVGDLPTGVNLAGRGLTPVYVRADGAALPFASAFDAIFSAAVFHWIPDHDQLFRSVHQALKPGGRVIAQCGGAGNLDRLYGRARALMDFREYRVHFTGWTNFNHFENVADTEQRLYRAGFEEIDVSLVNSPVTFDTRAAFNEFVAAVCLRHHLDRLPSAARDGFMRQITDQACGDDPPLTLDYWRLNIAARKGRA
ncbi:MAG TPA: methyltransferase domain-containing protein [Vicinamibacterales bacterium]|nr:methyltransferase domain-containing protein [Vicinamibacterales bacterium]